MRDIGLDIRHAMRVLRSAPASTISAILTLALGVGMTTSIFSVVNGVVLRPLPFPDDSRLVTICERFEGSDPTWCGLSPPNAEDIAARSRTISAMGIGRQWSYHLDTPEGAESINAGLATPGLFKALGVNAERGRLIEDADLIGDESVVALLSHEAWTTRFGSDPSIVGRAISIDRKPVTIVGILPAGFALPYVGARDIWRPLHINPRDEKNREWRGFVSYARLAPGASVDDARREIAVFAKQLHDDHFTKIPQWGLNLIPTRDLVVGSVRPMLYLFLGAVVVVLLIGCANVANLLLARSTARSREMALRAALGASGGRIARALLVESLLLALIGGALGVGFAVAATRAFKAIAPPGIPRIDSVAIDARVLLFALGVSVLTTLVFGLAPAIRAARVQLATSLREGGRGSDGRHGRLSAALVVGEIALAVMLVASAGLLTRTFISLTTWQPGFDRSRTITFSIFAPTAAYPRATLPGLMRRLETEMRAIPGVSSAATASAGPLFGGRETWEMEVLQRGGVSRQTVRWYDASPSYFATLSVPIVRGRALSEDDVRNEPESAGVVNETLANRFWPGEDPIGKTLAFPIGNERAVFRVVGVARDVPPMRTGDAVEPQLFWSNRAQPRPFTYVIVRSELPASSIVPMLRARVKAADRNLVPNDIQTIDERMQGELKTPRFSMLLVTAFGFAALFFAAIGTYGLLSYVVAQRTREIGIRIALGAEPRRIRASVVRGGLALALTGTGIGLLLTLAAGRVMRNMVSGVGVSDPVTLAGATVVLILVAILACYVPAWRASRVDPLVALSGE